MFFIEHQRSMFIESSKYLFYSVYYTKKAEPFGSAFCFKDVSSSAATRRFSSNFRRGRKSLPCRRPCSP